MTDPHNLPAISDDRLKPCAGCGQPIGPTFWIIQPVRCVLDGDGVRQLQGLATMLGSIPIARAMGGAPLAREFDRLPEICLCETCACTHSIAELSLKDAA